MTDEVFIAEESVSTKLAEPAAPPTPAIPATPTVPATPQKEIALATTKVKTDSTPISEITARQADKKDMIAKIQATSQPQGAPVAAVAGDGGSVGRDCRIARSSSNDGYFRI